MIKFNYDLEIDLYSNKPVTELSDKAMEIVRKGLKKIQKDVDSLNKDNDE
jgi:hypothetical protein